MTATQASVLVVDDNPDNRDMLSRRLARRGYTVAVAEDGDQALKMSDTEHFDLVLLDIMMPGMSGLEVLKILRERYSVADLPVIMATAKDQSSDIVEALKIGANDYVTKPLDFPVVLARVETQLALKRATEEIRRLADQLELRNRFIRETFGRYLTDDVVANLLDSPTGLQLGGEKRKITMMMSDLRGFTSLSERLAPERVVALLNRYLATMVTIIKQYQGTIDEFIGDAIFVLFGAPVWQEDDAQRAVACAVAMQLAMTEVNAQNRQDGLPEVEMGIGVHTGEVVVGNIGSPERMKYGVVGSHVNLTSRIQSFTLGGQILISEATRQDIGLFAKIGKEMEVKAKGFEQPIPLSEIRGIGGEHNLVLPQTEDKLVPLPQEIPFSYTVVEGDHLSGEMFTGSFIKLSPKGAEARLEHPVPPLSNLNMHLIAGNGEEIPGVLYGKVVEKLSESSTDFSVRFTSMPPEVETFLRDLLKQCSPGNAA
ncbi:MAG: adenylate/guanylate cyclase domain-containing protein [Candidatus Binatia bacterium]